MSRRPGKWEDWPADARFIDKGGFGSSWIDNLRRLGREPIGIAFLAARQTRATRTRFRTKGSSEGAAGLLADDADAFALTFAQPVAARDRYWDRTMEAVGIRSRLRVRPKRVLVEYDVLKGA